MKISSAAVKTVIDGEIVIMNVDSGNFFALKDTAAAIWTRLEAGVSPESMVESLSSEYDLDNVSVQDEVDAFLDQLHQLGLLDA